MAPYTQNSITENPGRHWVPGGSGLSLNIQQSEHGRNRRPAQSTLFLDEAEHFFDGRSETDENRAADNTVADV